MRFCVCPAALKIISSSREEFGIRYLLSSMVLHPERRHYEAIAKYQRHQNRVNRQDLPDFCLFLRKFRGKIAFTINHFRVKSSDFALFLRRQKESKRCAVYSVIIWLLASKHPFVSLIIETLIVQRLNTQKSFFVFLDRKNKKVPIKQLSLFNRHFIFVLFNS